jgi:hypothetical protein
VQQLDSRSQRRGPSVASSSSLPQFDLPAWEAADPDRTLERLPALSSSAALLTEEPHEPPPSSDVEPDMASTVELAPEVSGDDIIESAPARELPALFLPPAVSVPVDLNRLLAYARAETSRSSDFFRPATLVSAPQPPAPAVLDDETPLPTTAPRSEPIPLVVAASNKRRRVSTWGMAAAAATALLVVGIVAGQSTSSSAMPLAAQVIPQVSQSAPVTPAPESAAPEIPAVAVQSLPRVAAGTISLAAVAASHRLYVDGKVVPNGSASVTCGSHLVQVGSRGARRRVEVACGQEVVLAN